MAAIKSYTSLEQSRKLAEILPLESVDMFLAINGTLPVMSKYIDDGLVTADETASPCWSLSSLLNILPSSTLDSSDDHYYRIRCNGRVSEWHNNPIDAVYELILKLNELKLL